MYPIMHPLCTAGGDVLGYFAFVVREHEVHSSAVDVKFFAKVFGAHYRALEVPPGETFSPR